MTQPDPDSSPEYDPYELFKEELDLDEFDLESTSAPSSKGTATHQESVEAPFATQDEDRLYTDELIRQNEMASRSLFLSVITAALISVGIGLWYLLSQKPTVQPVAPLPVPEQPTLTPPGLGIPVLPTAPTPPSNQSSTQVPSLAPSDSVTVPGSTVTPNPNLTSPTNPSSSVVPPPPPSPPVLPNNSNR